MDTRSQTWITNRLYNKSGAAILVALLSIAVLLMAGLVFVVPTYRQHRIDQKKTFDILSVKTAEEVAKVEYLQNSEAGAVTYYYDEISHKVLDRSKITSIEPYGRSGVLDNLNGETGAIGIPHTGEEDGAQLLAITVYSNGTTRSRWTGKIWTYQDYRLMTTDERSNLTGTQLRQMDLDSMNHALSRARQTYAEDFSKVMNKDEDPGTAVYLYDRVTDSVIYDISDSQAKNQSVSIPEEATKSGFAGEMGSSLTGYRMTGSEGVYTGTAKDITGYGLTDGAGKKGGIIRVTVSVGTYLKNKSNERLVTDLEASGEWIAKR